MLDASFLNKASEGPLASRRHKEARMGQEWKEEKRDRQTPRATAIGPGMGVLMGIDRHKMAHTDDRDMKSRAECGLASLLRKDATRQLCLEETFRLKSSIKLVPASQPSAVSRPFCVLSPIY